MGWSIVGVCKLNFRRHINNLEPKDLHCYCMLYFGEEYLNIGTVRKFARRTRDYCDMYIFSAYDVYLSKEEVIQLAKELNEEYIDLFTSIKYHYKERKCHRNILDIDSGIISRTNS